MKQVNSRPLSDIRVLDFGQYLAGPLVGMMLADMGAEVIRIDPPSGPSLNEPVSDMLSRGKTSLTLNLKSEKGRATALELARRSDVLIENFRPGVMQRLGLGVDALQAANPQLVTLSMPGFASTDAELADLPAWEAVIAARTGQFTDMGLNRRLMGINPSFTPLSLASAYGATFGAMSVLFALYARERNGGDHIEVPLASALLEGLVYNCQQIEDYPPRYRSPREVELNRREEEGLPCNLPFDALSEFLDPFYRTYTCADGRGFYVVAGSVANHPRRVLEVLGLTDLLQTLPDFNAYLDSTDWPAEWSLSNYPVGQSDRAKVSDAMKAAFLTKPTHEWEKLFGAIKAPATAQRHTCEWLADEHALSSGLILQVNDPKYGIMRQMGNIAWLTSDNKATEKDGCLNQKTDSAWLENILSEPPRTGLKSGESAWLEGLKVLDLTNVIAGPTVGSTLARFGAEVTLVQPVTPSVDPWNTVVFGVQAQRGKESILLNLATDEGQEVLSRLVANCDVITFNGTDEQRRKLGLTRSRLKSIKPSLILVQLDAFGGPLPGPKSNHLGYDDLAQAATGVMLRFGGGMNTPEEHAHFGTIDVLTGFCACVALGGALLQMKRSGVGDIARSSLAAAGNMIQTQFMYDFEGRAPFNEPSGRETLGWGPYYHCYQAADQWFFFAAPSETKRTLRRCSELADLVDSYDGDDLTIELQKRFKQKKIAHWQKTLMQASTTVVALTSLHDTCEKSLKYESRDEIDLRKATFQVIRHDRHPMGRWCDLVAPNAVRPQKASILIPAPAPKYGEHTRDVLARHGYQNSEIENMLLKGIASEQWSEKYLPE